MQRRDTTNQGPSRTSISMSMCFMRRSVYGLWRGGEPTPGRFPTQLVYVVVRTNYAATAPRHNRIRRAEDPHDSVTAKIREHRRDASSGVEVGAAADGLPGVDLVPECVECGAEAVRGVVAEEQHVRGVVGLDGLDECGGGLGGVAGLGAVDGVVLLAALAGGVGVVSDDGGGLSEGAAGEVGAEGAGLDDSSGDADRCDFLAQRQRERLDRSFDGGVVARAFRRDPCTDRGEVDNRARAACAHAGQDRLDGAYGSEDVSVAE